MSGVSSGAVLLTGWTLLFLCAIFSCPLSAGSIDVGAIIARLEAAYARVDNYQTSVEVRSFDADGSVKVEKFLYTFKKPKWIRLDMETPHPGMVLIYPDEKGKVWVRPSGRMRFLAFHLSPDNRLLRVSSGQRLDQTDMGQLITNMSHSLTGQRKGPVSVAETRGEMVIRVLAADHFRPGVTTLYGFRIDERFWLPVAVEEATPAGRVKRVVTFRDLLINTGITQAFFGKSGG